MRISNEMEKLINEQINHELHSMNLYLQMASYFLDQELNGFANFFRVQSDEEHAHAMRQFDYLHDVGGKLHLAAIESVQMEFNSVLHVFEITAKHEQEVTAAINRLVEQALEEKDYATHTFFQWFVTEQVEEEALMCNILSKVKRIGDNSSALYMLDEEMGRRKQQPTG